MIGFGQGSMMYQPFSLEPLLYRLLLEGKWSGEDETKERRRERIHVFGKTPWQVMACLASSPPLLNTEEEDFWRRELDSSVNLEELWGVLAVVRDFKGFLKHLTRGRTLIWQLTYDSVWIHFRISYFWHFIPTLGIIYPCLNFRWRSIVDLLNWGKGNFSLHIIWIVGKVLLCNTLNDASSKY